MNGNDVQNAMIKPVYIKNRKFSRRFVLYERDLWRVYLKTKEAISLLIVEGYSNSKTYRCKIR